MKQPSRFRRAVYGAIAGITAFGALSGLAVQSASAAVTVTNTYGANRYQSADTANRTAFPNGVATVGLADAIPGHQSDALAASGWAGANKNGILLTDNTTSVPADGLTALSDNKVKNVVALGGGAAISPSQVAQLTGKGYTVTQPFQGANRWQTMQMIDDSIPASSVGTSTCAGKSTPAVPTGILASANDNHLVDSIAAGGLAYAKVFPVILTDSTASALRPEAAQVISALGIKCLIVVGGNAAVPTTQYSPLPTGVTAVDTSATTGADRSATSELLEKDEVANYGADNNKLYVAAGSTYYGTTTTTQNDGADALAAAPLAGTQSPAPACVSIDPATPGSLAQCNKDLPNLSTVFVGSGPSSFGTADVSAATGGGGTTPSGNAYTVSAPSPSATPPASTSSAPSQGATTYTVTGLPTSGATVNIALFPCTGTSQTGNGPTNGAPGSNSSGGTTFTAPGGTSPVAGSAIGQGTSTNNSPATNANWSNGSVSGSTATAYIASVNGVPTATRAAAPNDNGPTQLYNLSAPNGNLSFVVNSNQLDCVVPVVYTAPTSAGTTAPLLVNANGTPQSGYAVGAGGLTFWSAPAAPATSGGYIVEVVLAPPLAGTNMFDGMVVGCTSSSGANGNPALNGTTANCPSGVTTFAAPTTRGSILAFNYGTGGSSYFYTDGTPLSATNFGTYLSAINTSQTQPNSTTAAPVDGDLIDVGKVTGGSTANSTPGYSASAPASFGYDSGNIAVSAQTAGVSTLGDVPAAPTNVTATFNGAAFTNGSGVSQPGVVVSWTPPANPDVNGLEATVTGGAYSTTNAAYNIWRATVTNGTTGAASLVGTEYVINNGTTPNNGNGQTTTGCTSVQSCTSMSAPQFIDTTAATGSNVVYYVTATASSAGGPPNNGGGKTGPFSPASSATSVGSSLSAPVITAVTINASTVTCATGALNCQGTGTPTSGSPGYAIVYYNQNVTCLSAAGPDFTYSNSGGAPTNAKGSTCAQQTANSLIITFPSVFVSGTNATGGPNYSAEVIAAPGTGDTFSYTPPGTNTTSNAVYSGSSTSPVYEAAQTVTDNGNPSATGCSGTTASPSNPLSAGGGPNGC